MLFPLQGTVAAHPDKPIIVAEFGLSEPAFTGGDPKRIEILLENTEVYRRYPNIGGFIFFSLNDYRTNWARMNEKRDACTLLALRLRNR